MQTPIHWGILGTGNIASQFAHGLTALPDAKLLAVGSRSQASADRFGDRFSVPRRYASYDALAADPDVEAVYIGTPHTLHRDNALLCLEAGKAVLCEKPFAINLAEAQTMVQAARERGVFLMEAMWTRYLPAFVKIRELLAAGAIGAPQMLIADFGFRAAFNPASRLFDPALGGGALLDVGIYPVSLASLVFGQQPEHIASQAVLGESGVDEQDGMIFTYPGGQQAILSTSLRATTPMVAYILGTEGAIEVHPRWWVAEAFSVILPGKTQRAASVLPERLRAGLDSLRGSALGRRVLAGARRLVQGPAGQVYRYPLEGNGYNYEAAEVARCLRAGETESAVTPLDETLAIMATLDEIRAQWGLKYPME